MLLPDLRNIFILACFFFSFRFEDFEDGSSSSFSGGAALLLLLLAGAVAKSGMGRED
jgi:hypothetical protein